MAHNSASPRFHIVLVPGFAGFDALGQMEYYAGVTPQFRRWREDGNPHASATVLHYFDNFPTAPVATRAKRLKDYLAKRILRGEFLKDDQVALVGHSTGGLDIRRLICDLVLHHQQEQRYFFDGVQPFARRRKRVRREGTDFSVAPGEILHLINRVVFLSVPQWGTNIADWVHSYRLQRTAIIADLRATVAASQVPFIDLLQSGITEAAAELSDSGILWAARDALKEAEVNGSNDPSRTASAEQAASDIELWLRHMASDFGAIDDLASWRDEDSVELEDPTASPAHFSELSRHQEIKNWRARGITTRSYATCSASPFRPDSGGRVTTWNPLNPLTDLEVMWGSGGTDLAYRICYRACEGGPFVIRNGTRADAVATLLNSGKSQEVKVSANDGIVNTASMLWPDGKRTLLVGCDHMDIVGHYHAVKVDTNQGGRKYQAYDLLQSHSNFDDKKFAQVWNGVFDFCVSEK